MSIVVEADFIGDVTLNVGNRSTDFQVVIDNVERKVLIDLLGYDLYVLFIAGLAETPTVHAKWTALKNGADQCRGVKKMLKYFIYAEWINTGNYINTVSGMSSNQAENATALTPGQIAQLYDNAYNKGVAIYKEVADWIDEINSSEEITSVVGLTVNTADTKYLVNGDTVTIGGEDYVIGDLVADTSFTTSTSVGNATSWQMDFFEDYDHTEKDLSVFGGSL